uniref:Reverse transcriptase domain-containing protein n=1 Tax=Tanacetum cinerariifolium TaxID=118510 RepID=A0A6L2P6Y3_TANCI|nr:hypothetical protein [Tanacetum cinerariifolium]
MLIARKGKLKFQGKSKPSLLLTTFLKIHDQALELDVLVHMEEKRKIREKLREKERHATLVVGKEVDNVVDEGFNDQMKFKLKLLKPFHLHPNFTCSSQEEVTRYLKEQSGNSDVTSYISGTSKVPLGMNVDFEAPCSVLQNYMAIDMMEASGELSIEQNHMKRSHDDQDPPENWNTFHNDMCKPLPLAGPPGKKTIPTSYFFNRDLEYLMDGDKEKKSSSKLSRDQTFNPTSSTNPTLKGRIHRSFKQKVENFNFEEHLPHIATMTDNRTMAEMLRTPTEVCEEAIVVPSILAEQFELKHSLSNMMTSKDVPNYVIKLILFPFSLAVAARQWLEKEPPHSITTWDDLKFDESFHDAWERYKDLLRACPHHGFTELHQLDTFYNALNPGDQDTLNANAGGNLLEKSPQDALTIIENKSKVRSSRSKPISSPVNACDINSSSEIAKLTHAVNQQTSAVTTAMTAMLKQLQANPPPAQNFHLNELEKIKRMNDVSMKAMQNQIDMVTNELRNEMKTSIQTFLSNQTNEIKNMMASLLQMNTASISGSGSLLGNTVANPKGKLKAITTRSGLVTDGPTVPTPPKSVTPEEDECVEETYTDPDLAEYKSRSHLLPSKNISLHFKETLLCIHGTLLFRISRIPQECGNKNSKTKMKFKSKSFGTALHSNKEKLQELANTHLNENCSAVILKKLPKKLRDPGKFVIPCGFSELKCKALADLGASINLMPLFVSKKLGLPDLIPTRITLELANRAICTPDGITRDVFVSVGKFTFPADFVVVDYESDPRVPLILGRPFLRTTRTLIDVHGEEMILRDGDERLTLNMKHDTANYYNYPHRESVNLINIFNVSSEDCLEVSVSNPTSGNPTFSLHKEMTSEIEFLLYQGKDSGLKDLIDQTDLANLDAYFVDPTPEMFTDEHAFNYSCPSRFDVYPDDFLEIKSDADNFYDDPFDSKGEKIKESELLIDELDLPCDFLPYSEYDSFDSQDFSRVDALPSPDNEDKVFNPGILIQEKSVKIITRVSQEKKLATSYASLVFEDFDPLFYEPLVFKDVPKSMMLLPFSSENEEKVFKPGIYTSEKKEYSSLGCSSVPFLSPLIRSSMGEFGPAHRPETSASWEAPQAYQYFSILGNMKTLANGFCIQVFISSV